MYITYVVLKLSAYSLKPIVAHVHDDHE